MACARCSPTACKLHTLTGVPPVRQIKRLLAIVAQSARGQGSAFWWAHEQGAAKAIHPGISCSGRSACGQEMADGQAEAARATGGNTGRQARGPHACLSGRATSKCPASLECGTEPVRSTGRASRGRRRRSWGRQTCVRMMVGLVARVARCTSCGRDRRCVGQAHIRLRISDCADQTCLARSHCGGGTHTSAHQGTPRISQPCQWTVRPC